MTTNVKCFKKAGFGFFISVVGSQLKKRGTPCFHSPAVDVYIKQQEILYHLFELLYIQGKSFTHVRKTLEKRKVQLPNDYHYNFVLPTLPSCFFLQYTFYFIFIIFIVYLNTHKHSCSVLSSFYVLERFKGLSAPFHFSLLRFHSDILYDIFSLNQVNRYHNKVS